MHLGLLLGAALALGTVPASAPSGWDDLDVPFVAQTPLLCGGAAAAMVERFWGARGRNAEDYQSLVRPSEGGIRTSDLAAEMRRMGYSVLRSTGTPAAAARALADGVPPIVLIGRNHGAFHYVVVTALTPTEAIVHDPNFGPSRVMDLDDFLTRWADSDYWSLEIVPMGTTPTDPAEEAGAIVPPLPLQPAIDSVMHDLREGRYHEAAKAAAAIGRGPAAGRALGHRLLATALYLDGDGMGALDAWNMSGEPKVDHVEIEGLPRTRHHVAARQMATTVDRPLTRTDLALSERRLVALPSVQSARVSYRPNPDGTVQVTAFTLERNRWPDRMHLMRSVVQGVANRSASVSTGPFLASADVWTLAARWSVAQRGLRGSLRTAMTEVPGIVSVELDLTEEQHLAAGDARPSAERRLAGGVRYAHWVSPGLRLSGSLGVDRWTSEGTSSTRMMRGGAEVLMAAAGQDRWLQFGVEGWAGDGTLVDRTRVSGGLRFDTSDRTAFRFRLAAVSTSPVASRTLWPGAGTGSIREGLLRAHPLEANGSVSGAALGTRMANGTAEFRGFERFGPARVGVMVFTDAVALSSAASGPGSRHFLDFGIGAFADLGEEEVTFSLARGRPGWVVSLRADRWAPSL